MSSDGYNHFLLNPSGLVVGGPPASTPAAAPESAIQRLLGGAPELLDRISEQAAEMSFLDPLSIYYEDIEKLYDNPYDDYDYQIRWWMEHGRFAYRSMLDSISQKLDFFEHQIIRRGTVDDIRYTIPNTTRIRRDIDDLRAIFNRVVNNDLRGFEDFKSYHHLYERWKNVRGGLVGLLDDDRMLHTRTMGNWIIKGIDDTFTSMRELLLSMAHTPWRAEENPLAPLSQKYFGKRDLTKRILNGKPHTPSQ